MSCGLQTSIAGSGAYCLISRLSVGLFIPHLLGLVEAQLRPWTTMDRRAVNHSYICNTLLNDTMRRVSAFIESHRQAL